MGGGKRHPQGASFFHALREISAPQVRDFNPEYAPVIDGFNSEHVNILLHEHDKRRLTE